MRTLPLSQSLSVHLLRSELSGKRQIPQVSNRELGNLLRTIIAPNVFPGRPGSHPRQLWYVGESESPQICVQMSKAKDGFDEVRQGSLGGGVPVDDARPHVSV